MKKILLSVSLCLGLTFMTGCSEAWNRNMKEWQSNHGGGLSRKMVIYSENGEILAEYDGKFDISYSDGRIKFLQDGKMRNIYIGNSATVIVEEH